MEIVSYVGFKNKNNSAFDSVLNFLQSFRAKRMQRSSLSAAPFRVYGGHSAVQAKRVSVRRYERGGFKAILGAAGNAANFLVMHAKIIALCAAVIVLLLGILFAALGVSGYFRGTAGTVSMHAEDETAALSKIMASFALDEKPEYASDGSLVDVATISEADIAKLFRQPVTFSQYKVLAGDTISSITKKFGLKNISTLIAVNDIDNVRQLRSGQKLRIPSMDGLYYTVQSGNTLQGISLKYGVTLEDLLDVNELDDSTLTAGQQLFIPGAKLDSAKLQQAMGELFKCPIVAKFRLTSRFGPRADPFTGAKSNHTGVDLACPTGTPILATASGTVTYSGTSPVFGNYVIINHGNGYQSLYGHMSKTLAQKGQRVSQGTRIGLVGSTGYSTGPHLHFTVYKNGKLIDPLTLIK